MKPPACNSSVAAIASACSSASSWRMATRSCNPSALKPQLHRRDAEMQMYIPAQSISTDGKQELIKAKANLVTAVDSLHMALLHQSACDGSLIIAIDDLRIVLEKALPGLRKLIADNGILATDGGSK